MKKSKVTNAETVILIDAKNLTAHLLEISSNQVKSGSMDAGGKKSTCRWRGSEKCGRTRFKMHYHGWRNLVEDIRTILNIAAYSIRLRSQTTSNLSSATTWFPSLPKLQERRSKKKQAYRLMF
uniref:Uncharacterized protein n=1 Tax=Zea mays TaxID=4577 RepID=A0A804MSE8_MAIZE